MMIFKKTKTGASIAINGVCLTVISVKGKQAVFEVGPETLKKSISGFLVLALRLIWKNLFLLAVISVVILCKAM